MECRAAANAPTRIKTVYRPIEPSSRTVGIPSSRIHCQLREIPQAIHTRGVQHRDKGHRDLFRLRTL
jgi:hypothetical protein